MSIGAISNANYQVSQTSQVNARNDAGATDEVEGRRPPPPPGGGLFDAIAQALTSIGVGQAGATQGSNATSTSTGSATAASDSATTTDAAAAVGDFMKSLMAALHAQGSAATEATAAGGDGNADVAAKPAHHHHGGGRLESDLQSLIKDISSSSPGTADSSATGSSTSTAESDLQKSFDSLVSALGSSGSGATLGGFLQALSSALPGAGTAGNVVDTKA